MAKLVLEIPEDIQAAMKIPPSDMEQELKKELALALYQREVLSLGTARRLASLTRWEFEELLAERRVPRHYSAEEMDEDLGYGRGH